MIKCSGAFISIFGRWTPEGNLYYKLWNTFKKYLTDLSALKEYPPESIKIWDSYLVHAASLGVAREALQNMSRIVPSEQLKESHFYPISYNYSQSECGCGNACSSFFSGDANREDNIGSGSGGGGWRCRIGTRDKKTADCPRKEKGVRKLCRKFPVFFGPENFRVLKGKKIGKKKQNTIKITFPG